jgi:integrase
MVQPKTKRKTRSDKFPLTLHPTGQFCKKIKGKLYYFGSDKTRALEKYLAQASYLHSGQRPATEVANGAISITTLCNLYLEHQATRVEAGEIGLRQLHDQTKLLKDFVKWIGPSRDVSEIVTMDLQNYRAKLIKQGKCAGSINNYISAFKAMYHWAFNNEVIAAIPKLDSISKVPRDKKTKQIFTAEQIKKLLELANSQIKAMILLGLNCGFGCTDCSELLWENVDLKNARINFARTKTQVGRNLPLWKETVTALEALHKVNERVFNTYQGNKYVHVTQKENSDGSTRMISYNHVTSEFSRLIQKAGIKTEKGVGFYTLRRTAATLAAKSGDPFAVQKLLGHADLKMASVYVQDVSEQTDRVINNSRKLIIQDES